MVAKYCRFFGVSDSYVMQMPVKRFFVLYRQIRRINAEETLELLRVISQPYIDPKKSGGDRFIEQLWEDAKVTRNVPSLDLATSKDLREWGIGVKREPDPTEIDGKGFEFKQKNG